MENIIFSPKALQELEEKRNQIAERGTVCKADVLMLKENINMEDFTNTIELNKYTTMRSKVNVSKLLEEMDILINKIKTDSIVTRKDILDSFIYIISTMGSLSDSIKNFNTTLNENESSNLLEFILNKKQSLFYFIPIGSEPVLTDMSKVDITNFENSSYIEYINKLLNTYRENNFANNELTRIINELSTIDYLKIQNSNVIRRLLNFDIKNLLDILVNDSVDESLSSFSSAVNEFISITNSTTYTIPSLQDIICKAKCSCTEDLSNQVNELKDNLYRLYYNVVSLVNNSDELYVLYKELTFFKEYLNNVKFTSEYINKLDNLIRLIR